MAYSDKILFDGPVAYWRLGESTGTTANDEIGTHDGTYNNTPTLGATGAISGDSDTAVDFNATNSEYVSVSDHNELSAENSGNGFTVEAWVKFDTLSGNRAVVVKGGTNWEWSLKYESTGNVFWWDILANDGYHISKAKSDSAPSTATWYHLVGTWDGTEARLYVNGTIQTTARESVRTTYTNNTDPVNFGRRPNGDEYIDGIIDEVAIYDYNLTSTQVTDHYDLGQGDGVFITVDTSTATGNSITDHVIALDAEIDATAFTATGDSLTDHLVEAGSGIIPSTATATADLGDSVEIWIGAVIDWDTAEATASIPNPTLEVQEHYASAVESDGGKWYWRMNEASGTTVEDALAANDLTANTSVTSATGINGTDAQTGIDWRGNYAEMAQVTGDPYNWGTPAGEYGGCAYEFWYKHDGTATSSSFKPILGASSYGSTSFVRAEPENFYAHHGIGLKNGQLHWYREGYSYSGGYSPASADLGALLLDGSWHHVVINNRFYTGSGTRDDYYEFYRDGDLVSYGDFYLSLGTKKSAFNADYDPHGVINRINDEMFFDEVAVYDRFLTAEEVSEHYSLGRSEANNTITGATFTATAAAGDPDTVITALPSTATATGDLKVPVISIDGAITITVEDAEATADGQDPSLTILGSRIISVEPIEATAAFVDSMVKITIDDTSFKFIPSTDTSIAALDAEELDELDMGALLKSASKTRGFKLGNLTDGAVDFYLSLSSYNDILDYFSFSTDKQTWTPTITIEGIPKNGITPVIWIKFASDESITAGNATVLMNVEQTNA